MKRFIEKVAYTCSKQRFYISSSVSQKGRFRRIHSFTNFNFIALAFNYVGLLSNQQMSIDCEKAFHCIIDELNNSAVKYEANEFDSGVKMIDIWSNGSFYVIQIENEFIGISSISSYDNIDFSVVPDCKYFTIEDSLLIIREIIKASFTKKFG